MVIGILINIIALIILIVSLKTIKYINKTNVCSYAYKEWHTIKLPLWAYVLLILIAVVPYLGTLFYILVYYTYSDIDACKYYCIKPAFHKKLTNVINKIINLINTEI